MKFNELLLYHIKNGYVDFEIDCYNFYLSDWYKWRDPYSLKGCLIYLVKRDIPNYYNCGNGDAEIPIYWFNVELQKFTPFYGSRARDCPSMKNNRDFKYFNIKDFKEFKKIQKKYLEEVNNLMLKKCYPLYFKLNENLKEKGEKEKVRKI